MMLPGLDARRDSGPGRMDLQIAEVCPDKTNFPVGA